MCSQTFTSLSEIKEASQSKISIFSKSFNIEKFFSLRVWIKEFFSEIAFL